MSHHDLAQVMAIEGVSFPDSWEHSVFERALRSGEHLCRVMLDDDEIIGFFVARSGARRCHLANLAIARNHRRRGRGRLALQELEDVAKTFGHEEIVLEVRDSNLPAQLLYRDAGYRATKVLKGHYGEDDGYRMSKNLTAK